MTEVIRRALLAGFYPPPFAGECVHVQQLAGLIRSKGLPVEIVNLNRRAAPSDEYWLPTGRLSFGRILWRRLQAASVLHLHTNGHSGKSWMLILGSGLVARLRGARAILTLHSGLVPAYLARCGRLGRFLAGLAVRQYARVVCVNPDIRDALASLGTATPLEVIAAYLPSASSAEVVDSDRRFLESRSPVLLVVAGGDVDPEVGLIVALASLKTLVTRYPTIAAVLIGWRVGPRTIPLIQQLGLENHALCLGEVTHERCLSLMRAATVVVRSTYADGDAITVREALDLGIPVVASDVVRRPPGAVLFKTGDDGDLSRKLIQVLDGGDRGTKGDGTEGQRIAVELWRVYQEVGASESPIEFR
jgi:glycogen(starch) synthase